jgi:signal transduction histidine kinase
MHLCRKPILILISLFAIQPLLAYSISPEKDKLLAQTDTQQVWTILRVANENSLRDIELALKLAEIALKRAYTNQNGDDVFDVERTFGLIYEDNTRWQEAVKHYELAAIYATKTDQKLTIYTDIAIASRKAGEYQKAFEYHNRTLRVAEESSDLQMIESSYHGLGNLHRDAGVYDHAISYYLKSLEISQQRGSPTNVIVSYIDLADTYLRAKDPEKALEHIKKGYELSLEHKEKNKTEEAIAQFASVLNRYAEVLTIKKEYEEALLKHREALRIYHSLNIRQYIGQTLMFIADVQTQQGNYGQAEKTFEECLTLKNAFLVNDFARLELKMADFFYKQGKYEKSELHYQESLKTANKHEFKDIAQKCNYKLFLLYLNFYNNKERALVYLNKANELNDLVFNEEKRRQTAEIELKFNVEKTNNELNRLRLEQNSFQLRQNKILLISSIVFSLMLIIFLTYIIKLRGKNYATLKAKNEEIKQQYKRLEESNEILRQFAYVAAHDLKEPLRSIGSYISLVQMKYSKSIDDKGKEYFNFVNAGVKRMYSLLTDLLDFSQVLAQQPGAEVLRPEEVLTEVTDNFRTAIESRNAVVEFPQNMPTVRMHRLHMLQLFQNLIGNALKFNDKMPPIIKVDGKMVGKDLLFTVEDNGIGIKPEYANKVFILFQQLNKKIEGTGIGLTICKNIVDKYDGKIWFESEENIGTKFFISIPVVNA